MKSYRIAPIFYNLNIMLQTYTKWFFWLKINRIQKRVTKQSKNTKCYLIELTFPPLPCYVEYSHRLKLKYYFFKTFGSELIQFSQNEEAQRAKLMDG